MVKTGGVRIRLRERKGRDGGGSCESGNRTVFAAHNWVRFGVQRTNQATGAAGTTEKKEKSENAGEGVENISHGAGREGKSKRLR